MMDEFGKRKDNENETTARNLRVGSKVTTAEILKTHQSIIFFVIVYSCIYLFLLSFL